MRLLQNTARAVSGAMGRDSWVIRRLRPAYEGLLDKSTGGHGIPWEINGVTYRIDPRYRHQLGSNYDASVAAFLRERVKPGSVCLDVGANVGVYVLQFAHWSAPNGRVVAFEPNPSAVTILERHLEMNSLTNRVQVEAVAVSDSRGEAMLYAADAEGMSRLGAPNVLLGANTIEIKVPTVTLDHFCFSEIIEPDWLFVDIEGFEIAALAGARELIKRRKDQLGIIVEMHPNLWDSANTTRAEAEALISDLGLIAEPLTGQSDSLGEYGIVHLAYA